MGIKCGWCLGAVLDDDYEKCSMCEFAVHRHCGIDDAQYDFLCTGCMDKKNHAPKAQRGTAPEQKPTG